MTVGTRTIDFKASTINAVKNNIRTGFVLQGGGLEFENVVVAEEDMFISGRTYNFVGCIPLGK